MENQAQMTTDIKNQLLSTKTLEVQLGKLFEVQNTKSQRGIPRDTDLNPKKVNVISIHSCL